jgi:G3E family GTPase
MPINTNRRSKLAREGRFDYLMIESTGISESLPVAETFTFADETGSSLDLLVDQVEFANVIVISKADLVAKKDLRKLEPIVRPARGMARRRRDAPRGRAGLAKRHRRPPPGIGVNRRQDESQAS